MTAHTRSVQPPEERVLLRARNYLERGKTGAETHICSHVVRSWKRCLDAGLNPLSKPRNLVAENAVFGQVLARHNILRSLARPEMELLFGQVSGSNYLLALGSPEGVVMDVMADTSFQDTEAGRTIINGSIWTETVRGTNAMGLVLHDAAPRSVWQGEHFFRSQGRVSCIAVPIFDSYGAISGVLDASTGSEDWHPHSVALLNMSAANIESGLFHHQQQSRTILRVHMRSEYLETVSAGLIALDGSGTIVAMNTRARDILGVEAMRYPASLDDMFWRAEHDILSRLPTPDVLGVKSLRNGTVFMSCNQFRMRRAHAVASGLNAPEQLPQLPTTGSHGAIFEDARLARQLSAFQKIIGANLPIRISGESGSGKSTLARQLHYEITQGQERGEFVHARCSGLHDEASLNDLVDRVKEVFGTRTDRRSHLENPRTFFLEAVDELSEIAQSVLLRILDEWENSGSGNQGKVQIISSCSSAGQSEGPPAAMRRELFFRLGAFCITIPPLRHRSDLDQIAEFLLQRESPRHCFAEDALQMLGSHSWPGNIRQLSTAIRGAAALSETQVITSQDILTALHLGDGSDADVICLQSSEVGPCRLCESKPLRRERCILIRKTYTEEGGNASRTARKLGIARSTVYEHIG